MVAKVITGKTIRGVLSYNENKAKEGKAALIGGEGFHDDLNLLSFHEKLARFTYQMHKNPGVKTNAVHISLNFHEKDKLTDERLNNISQAYLDKIGFGEQPFLIYRHFDAAHPHVHLVTTNVKVDGARIDLHNIGRNSSEKARRQIETEFNLTKADGRKPDAQYLRPVDLAAAEYGKSETKRSISNIVNTVTRSYKYTSVHELNAVLSQFNVIADTGKEGSIVRAKQGLRYSIIDRKGQPIGIPIKASSIYGKPTLALLQGKFEVNALLRSSHKERLQRLIDNELSAGTKNFNTLISSLISKDVFPVVRQNDAGRIYGITFIDNQTKCVFNGSDLGKGYSAKAILDRLDKRPDNSKLTVPTISSHAKSNQDNEQAASAMNSSGKKESNILSNLTGAHLDKSDVDSNLKKKKRKKKGKSL